MKKVMLTLAVVAFVASLASCTKTCSCTTYAGGLSSEPIEKELEEGAESCADMTTGASVAGVKVGEFCE
ncbi:MAG: hypothetical protein J6V33_07045 [Bacteroidales bacterium]|jgi:hypothetical protein|nr:hypothetical protein [Bacteroidales bacterium]